MKMPQISDIDLLFNILWVGKKKNRIHQGFAHGIASLAMIYWYNGAKMTGADRSGKGVGEGLAQVKEWDHNHVCSTSKSADIKFENECLQKYLGNYNQHVNISISNKKH